MPVAAQPITCPSCGAEVAVSLAADKAVLGAGRGHTEGDDAVNQLCTECLDKIHVEVA